MSDGLRGYAIRRVLDARGRELLSYFDDDCDGTIDRAEYYARNDSGISTRIDFDDDMDGRVDRTAFDDNADGAVDRVEHYVRDVAGQVVRIRFDDDNDGNINRVAFDQNDDGAMDRVELYTLNTDGDPIRITAHDLPLSYKTTESDLFMNFDVGMGDVDNFAAPTFEDLDKDGDLDLVVGDNAGKIHYFENTGSATAPAFTKQPDAANPFSSVSVRNYAVPAFADLNGDGKPDLVVGEGVGSISYYENTGSASAPAFTERTGTANPFRTFNGINDQTEMGRVVPVFADVDGDGDWDLVVGRGERDIDYYENTGSATAPAFEERTGSANPFDGLRAAGFAALTFADVDRDGDPDVLVGRSHDGTHSLDYYENTGSALAPAFSAQPAPAGPFHGISAGERPIPAFADLNGDGVSELVVGTKAGGLAHYLLKTLSGNAYTRDVSGNIISVAFDDDGDGANDRTESYTLDSSGNVIRIDFDDNADSTNDRTESYTRDASGNIVSAAFDDDGDGTDDRTESYTRDASGNITSAAFDDDGDGTDDRTESHTRDASGNLTRIDFDDDANGYVDRVEFHDGADGDAWRIEHYAWNAAGKMTRMEIDENADGTLDWGEAYTLNDAGHRIGASRYDLPRSYSAVDSLLFDGIIVDYDVAPTFADLDGDGDLDLALVDDDGDGDDTNGVARYLENTGSATAPDFAERTGGDNLLREVAWEAEAVPAFADLDDDSDLDLIMGKDGGAIWYYKNTGNATDPRFERQENGAEPFSDISVEAQASPEIVDLDGDGDMDLVVGKNTGIIEYYKNVGDAMMPSFERKTGEDNPFNDVNVQNAAAPTLADWDRDGDLDLAVGRTDGDIWYYENTGSAENPEFEQREGVANPFDGIMVEANSTPVFADLDGDGDMDLAAGDLSGNIHYFENTGSAGSPAFTQRENAANPFHDINAGDYAAPAFADVDRDGDPDLVVGNRAGDVQYYENTSSAATLEFAAQASDSSNPFSEAAEDSRTTPAFADLDGDLMLELVFGNNAGELSHYEPAPERIETYVRNAAGQVTQTSADENADGSIDWVYFDYDADGANDRIEHHLE